MIFRCWCRTLFVLGFFLYATLIFHEDVFSMTAPHAPAHGAPEKERTGAQGGNQRKENLFSTIPEDLTKTFQLLVEAENPANLQNAILKTIQLVKQKGKASETAAFLLGDLYKKQWEQGDQKAMDQALLAYSRAIRTYTNTENASKALLKKGDIYFHNKLYPEAMGNYQRVLSQGLSNPYAIAAHVRMARSFQKWERWNDGLQLVRKSAALSFTGEERDVMASVHGDSLYQLGRFEEAYHAYQPLFLNDRPHSVNPTDLFQYGEVAYRTGHHRGAEEKIKALLVKAHDMDVQDPVSPLALARLSFLFKLGGDAVQAETAANLVYAMMSHVPNVKTGKLIVATGNLAVLDCPNPCTSGLADINFKQIAKVAKSLLLDVPFTVTAQGAVLDAAAQLQRYHRFDMAEDVYTQMIFALPSATYSPYIFYAKSKLRQTVFEHFDTLEKSKKIVSLYRRFRMTFEERLSGEAGLKIAKSFLKLGDLSAAINIFERVAQNKQHPASEEAMLQLGRLRVRLGEYKAAERAFVEYRIRYPEKPAILKELGDVYARQSLFEPAAVAYEEWLALHPNEPARPKIYEKLSDVYRSRQDLPSQIRVYESWIKEIPNEQKRPYMQLADLYYQQQRHKDAIRYFELALKYEKKPKEIDWALLRLANSYIHDKQREKGAAILQKIPKQAKDNLVKRIALDRQIDLKEAKP